MIRTMRIIPLVPLALAFVAGCTSMGSPDGSKPGDLGNGAFTYKCLDPSDPTCPEGGDTTAADFPTAVAVGGRFGIDYFPKDSSQQINARVFPVSKKYFGGTGDQFTAISAGSGGIVARAADTGDVLDYLPVKILDISRLSLIDLGANVPAADVSVKIGRQMTYRVRAQGSTQQTLAGAIDYQWTVTDATVLTLDQGNPTSEMTITAKAAGTAQLTVSYTPVDGSTKPPSSANITVTVTP